MAKFNLNQEVILFKDENAKSVQEVYIEDDEVEGKWISVIHDHEELTMSIKNWDLLVALVEKVKLLSNE